MITHLLLTIAAVGDHAALHPQDADLYLCAPDVQGALKASEGVGFRRLMEDPAIVELLGDDLDIPGVLSAGGEAVDLPEEALDLLWENAAAASMSVAGLDEYEAAPDLADAEAEAFIGVLLCEGGAAERCAEDHKPVLGGLKVANFIDAASVFCELGHPGNHRAMVHPCRS